jgi:YVTN family beta-propeller protein
VNTGSNNVSVIDLLTPSPPKTIAVGTRPVHVAVSPDGTRAFVANNGSNSLSVIDTVTRTVSDTITVDASAAADRIPQPSALGAFLQTARSCTSGTRASASSPRPGRCGS